MRHFTEAVLLVGFFAVVLLGMIQCRSSGSRFFSDKQPNLIHLHCPHCKATRAFRFYDGDTSATCPTCWRMVDITHALRSLESRQTEGSNLNLEGP